MLQQQEEDNSYPTLIHVAHAAIYIPDAYLADYRAEIIDRELLLMTDWYCDELFDLGRAMIQCPVSRLVCDVERFRDDADEAMAASGVGWYYTKCADGSELRQDSPRRRKEILEKYYDPHHAALEQEVRKRLRSHGRCLIIDGHSFFPKPLPYEADRAKERPDFCIGTDAFHTPQRLAEVCASFLKEKGYSVKLDSPFSGAIVPMKHYAKDVRVSSIMLEVNRRLYLDASANKNSSFAHIKQLLAELLLLLEDAFHPVGKTIE